AEEIQEREAESKPENTPAEGAASEEMILLPVKSLVLFPGLVLPIVVNRQASLYAAQEAVRRERPIGVVLQQNSEKEQPEPEELHRMGTVANILRYVTGQDGQHHLICQG